MPKTGEEPQPTNKPGILKILAIRSKEQRWVPLTLILFIVAGFTGGDYFYSSQVEKQQEQAHSAAKKYSLRQAETVNHYLTEQQQVFSAFMGRAWVIKALGEKDQQALLKLEGLLAKLSNDTVSNQIVFAGDERIGESQNYAATQMIKQAEVLGRAPYPEAIRYEDQWLFLLVTPLLDEQDEYLGALVSLLKQDSLREQLIANALPGQTRIIQKIHDLPEISVLSLGSAETNITTYTPTSNPHWRAEFRANSAIFDETAISLARAKMLILGVWVLFGLAIVGLIFRTYTRYQLQPSEINHKPAQAQKAKAQAYTSDDSLVIEDALPDESPDVTDTLPPETPTAEPSAINIPPEIFREYDIRGLVDKQITTDFALLLGKAIGTLVLQKGETNLITGYDGRTTSPELYASLEKGVLSTGCNISRIGAVPTPVVNFAIQTHHDTSAGVMVTASHNPEEYNGFKICLDNRTASSEEIQQLYDSVMHQAFSTGKGIKHSLDVRDEYVSAVRDDVVPGFDLSVVVDAGNGIAGDIAIRVLEELGCQVIPLHCEVDGTFPNHPPDTSVKENLADLISAVNESKADLGIALDGDGDRIVAITPGGRIVWPDELLMIFARDVLARLPGADIVYDVKSTRRLNNLISSYGGRPVMWKTGHSNMRNKIAECDAPLGGEYSGHIFFRDRWHGFDDGIYAAARLIEIISTREQNLDEITAGFEKTFATEEIKIVIPEDEKFNLMQKIIKGCAFSQATISTLDGLRVDYPKGWGLIRASNTSPALTLRFEAVSEDALEKLQSIFRKQISSIDARLTF